MEATEDDRHYSRGRNGILIDRFTYQLSLYVIVDGREELVSSVCCFSKNFFKYFSMTLQLYVKRAYFRVPRFRFLRSFFGFRFLRSFSGYVPIWTYPTFPFSFSGLLFSDSNDRTILTSKPEASGFENPFQTTFLYEPIQLFLSFSVLDVPTNEQRRLPGYCNKGRNGKFVDRLTYHLFFVLWWLQEESDCSILTFKLFQHDIARHMSNLHGFASLVFGFTVVFSLRFMLYSYCPPSFIHYSVIPAKKNRLVMLLIQFYVKQVGVELTYFKAFVNKFYERRIWICLIRLEFVSLLF